MPVSTQCDVASAVREVLRKVKTGQMDSDEVAKELERLLRFAEMAEQPRPVKPAKGQREFDFDD